MDVRLNREAGTLYLDLDPASSRRTTILSGHHCVVLDLDTANHAVGLGLVMTEQGTLPGAARTALVRYCPEVVGDSMRPDWTTIRLHLLRLAGAPDAAAERAHAAELAPTTDTQHPGHATSAAVR